MKKINELNETDLLGIKQTGLIVIVAGIGDTDSNLLHDLASNDQIFFLENTTALNSTIKVICEDPLCGKY